MDKLQLVSLNDWTDDDWDFYEDYTDRKWSTQGDDDSGWGDVFYS
jgi:hypothetical protein